MADDGRSGWNPQPNPVLFLWDGTSILIYSLHDAARLGYVERYHRVHSEECLRVLRPGTEEEVREVTAAFLIHYNYERPNQARSCGNRPPRVAFPTLPILPALPEQVDPDARLAHIHGCAYARRVKPNGVVEVDRHALYLKQTLAGQQVVLVVNAKDAPI